MAYGDYAGGGEWQLTDPGISWLKGKLPGPLNLAGSVFSAIGNLMATNAQASGYKFGAKMKELEAKDVAITTKGKAADIDRAIQREAGRQRATYAALGLDTTEGAPIENLAEMAKQMTLAKAYMKRSAGLQIYGLQQEAKNLKSAAKSTKQAGILSAIGSFL